MRGGASILAMSRGLWTRGRPPARRQASGLTSSALKDALLQEHACRPPGVRAHIHAHIQAGPGDLVEAKRSRVCAFRYTVHLLRAGLLDSELALA